jgi:mono/diheme cytochrome c family protein
MTEEMLMAWIFSFIRTLYRSLIHQSKLALTLAMAGLALLLGSILVFATAAQAQAPASPAFQQEGGDGAEIFNLKCAGCHTIGGGKGVGPDLQDVTVRREPGWVKDFISDPDSMLDSDPVAEQLLKDFNNLRMPNLGLTKEEVDSLVVFLSDPRTLPQTPAEPTVSGSAPVGKLLFRGETPLTNGGPSCIACHSVNGLAGLGGGALGPDLTHAVQRLGETGLASSMKTISFPTMLEPFKNRPLTPQEQADLLAYLKDADRVQGPVQAVNPGALTAHTGIIFGIGLAGAIALFGLLLPIWMRLRKNYSPNLPVREVKKD